MTDERERVGSPADGTDNDRRRANRITASLGVLVQTVPAGVATTGWVTDLSASGLRMTTAAELPAAGRIQVSFENTSHNTRCVGRVVWTRKRAEGAEFESGVQVLNWGGDLPGTQFVENATKNEPA